MSTRKLQLLSALIAVGSALPTTAHAVEEVKFIFPETAYAGEVGIEPNAGNWRTWVIPSGRDFRVPPPPTQSETRSELGALAGLLAHNDVKIQQLIEYWDAGAPSYRWIEILNARAAANTQTSAFPHRVYAYMALAMHDATVATWESKYYYNRLRPSQFDRRLPTALAIPQSPSYPSEHAATAAAAAAILDYFLPGEVPSFGALAEQAGWSRVLAGLQFPSDHYAGLDLGRRVAARVIAKSQTDGADQVFAGTVPTGPCKWIGTNPGNVTAAHWTPLLLTHPGMFRPAPPPDCNSPQVLAEAVAVKNFARTFITNYKAYYWQSPEGRTTYPYLYASKWMFEDKLDRNPPRAARVYALLAASFFDAFIASQDGKFTYWYLRPNQLDSAIVPLFAVPNFPSYPSNHSTFSTNSTEMLAYLFPSRAAFIRAQGKEAGDSRIWAGIHFQMDNVAGVELGALVSQVFIQWAKTDGSQ